MFEIPEISSAFGFHCVIRFFLSSPINISGIEDKTSAIYASDFFNCLAVVKCFFTSLSSALLVSDNFSLDSFSVAVRSETLFSRSSLISIKYLLNRLIFLWVNVIFIKAINSAMISSPLEVLATYCQLVEPSVSLNAEKISTSAKLYPEKNKSIIIRTYCIISILELRDIPRMQKYFIHVVLKYCQDNVII